MISFTMVIPFQGVQRFAHELHGVVEIVEAQQRYGRMNITGGHRHHHRGHARAG
jgi:hypothetical protein